MSNILFLTYDIPFPTNSGGKVRAFNMMKFGGEGHNLYLFSFYRQGYDEKVITELKKIGIKSIETFKRATSKNINSLVSIVSPRSSVFRYLYF